MPPLGSVPNNLSDLAALLILMGCKSYWQDQALKLKALRLGWKA